MSRPTKKLSKRQLEVLALLADGMTLRGISRQLFLEEATVRGHATELRRWLGARTCAHAVAIGIRTGLLPQEDVT